MFFSANALNSDYSKYIVEKMIKIAAKRGSYFHGKVNLEKIILLGHALCLGEDFSTDSEEILNINLKILSTFNVRIYKELKKLKNDENPKHYSNELKLLIYAILTTDTKLNNISIKDKLFEIKNICGDNSIEFKKALKISKNIEFIKIFTHEKVIENFKKQVENFNKN